MVAALPDPARRYFLHAIRPGTPLAARLHWYYTGAILPGKGMPWLSLEAEQVVAKERGFAWKAKARLGPLAVDGDDYYLDGTSRMKIALFGLFPVVNSSGPDIAKSALGRLLVESFALPAALLPGPHVQVEGIDPSRFRVIVTLHGETTPLVVTVDQEGRVKEFVMQRWGNQTPDGSFQFIPYGFTADAEKSFGGYTIPSHLHVGWWFGTKQYLEVVRLNLEWARHW
jgi:hypothetical protein